MKVLPSKELFHQARHGFFALAVKTRDDELVEVLIEEFNVKINKIEMNSHGMSYTNMHMVFQYEVTDKITRYNKIIFWLKHGLDVNIRDRLKSSVGKPLLHHCVTYNDIKAVKLLLEKGASTEAPAIYTEYNKTPVETAVENVLKTPTVNNNLEIEMVKLLMKYGANLHRGEESAYLLAKKANNQTLLNLFSMMVKC
jgi:hypothetical protein